jgi:hypothetical protein
MKRREFMTLLGAATAWPLTAHAQQPGGMRRVGVLMATSADDPEGQARIAAFLGGLQQLDGTEGWSGVRARLRRRLAAAGQRPGFRRC